MPSLASLLIGEFINKFIRFLTLKKEELGLENSKVEDEQRAEKVSIWAEKEGGESHVAVAGEEKRIWVGKKKIKNFVNKFLLFF